MRQIVPFKRSAAVASGIVATLMLAACGIKGGLYLPPPAPKAPTAVPVPSPAPAQPVPDRREMNPAPNAPSAPVATPSASGGAR